jgi:magnesium transporter
VSQEEEGAGTGRRRGQRRQRGVARAVTAATRLPRLFRKRHPPPGSGPGTFAVHEAALPPRLRLIHYHEAGIEDREIDVAELETVRRTGGVTWLDIQGLGDAALIERVGALFDLHHLALADAVNVPQRPKSESYERHHFFIGRACRLRSEAEVETEQVSLFVGTDFVLTVQEKHGDGFDPVRARLHAGTGMLRRSGADYLAYALIDTVIDGYYPVLEVLGEHLEELEQETLEQPRRENLRRIYHSKRQLLELRRALWPQREAVAALIRDETPLFGARTRVYLRDCYDHAIQLLDTTETFRELASNLMDIYLSAVAQRTNETMKVLTIMASIFIPLTFIAGVYGMNFEWMPELERWWAYPAVLALMLAVAVGLLIYFRRRGWIGGDGG